MKRMLSLISVLCVATGVLYFQSCSKIKAIVKANVPITMEYSLAIPVIADTSQAVSDTSNFTFDVDAAIKNANNQLGIGNVKSASISSITLNILPADQDAQDNFTALSNLSVSMSSDQQPDWVSLCNITQPPTNPYEYDLPLNQNIDLASYFTSNNFHFLIAGKASRTTSKEIKCTATIKFIVVASL